MTGPEERSTLNRHRFVVGNGDVPDDSFCRPEPHPEMSRVAQLDLQWSLSTSKGGNAMTIGGPADAAFMPLSCVPGRAHVTRSGSSLIPGTLPPAASMSYTDGFAAKKSQSSGPQGLQLC